MSLRRLKLSAVRGEGNFSHPAYNSPPTTPHNRLLQLSNMYENKKQKHRRTQFLGKIKNFHLTVVFFNSLRLIGHERYEAGVNFNRSQNESAD
jgi:hypothetical protein